MIGKRHLWLGAGMLVLAGCSGGPQFVILPEKLQAYWPARAELQQARAASEPSDGFRAALHREYLAHAEYEFDPMQDYPDALHHARKALAAARGDSVAPDDPTSRLLPTDAAPQLEAAHARLKAVLAGGGAQKAPDATARAQAAFDCWLEQQEENFQPEDIARCRRTFEDAIAAAEAATRQAAQPMPAVITLAADVLFDFDKAVIKESFKPELDQIAAMLRDHPEVRVFVDGHTDTAGPAAYNMRLSQRRAQAVADYLAGRGVARERMEVRAFGETQLAVPTPDNRPEPRNRRVEIRRR